MFSLICVWINGWENKREADDFRRHCNHYDVTVMLLILSHSYKILVWVSHLWLIVLQDLVHSAMFISCVWHTFKIFRIQSEITIVLCRFLVSTIIYKTLMVNFSVIPGFRPTFYPSFMDDCFECNQVHASNLHIICVWTNKQVPLNVHAGIYGLESNGNCFGIIGVSELMRSTSWPLGSGAGRLAGPHTTVRHYSTSQWTDVWVMGGIHNDRWGRWKLLELS